MKRKTVMITGATSGIGEACARRFAASGYNLILTGRNTEKLESLKKDMGDGTEVLTRWLLTCATQGLPQPLWGRCRADGERLTCS